MAEYKSKYSELGFYIDGSLRQFRNGKYVTNDKNEIEILDKLKDVVRVDKPTETKAEPKAKATPKKGKASAKK